MYKGMRHIKTFRFVTDHIYADGPKRLYYCNIILYYVSLCCSCLQYSVQ